MINNPNKKNLVCVNGNDGQFAQLSLFCNTLKDKTKGAFTGDICILSTKLSTNIKFFFNEKNIDVHIDELKELYDLPVAKKIALFAKSRLKVISSVEKANSKGNIPKDINFHRMETIVANALFQKNLDEKLYESDVFWEMEGISLFRNYMNKHFSKLGILSYLDKIRDKYDKILLCDGDMIFQRPVEELFKQVNDNRICITNEIESITPGTHIYQSNKLAIDKYPDLGEVLEMGENAHELNVGVLLGGTSEMEGVLKKWKHLMFKSNFECLFTIHSTGFWHEQDFMRLLRDMNPNNFKSLEFKYIIHMCSLGYTIISEKKGVFKLKKNGENPIIVHFAGGTWMKYPKIHNAYKS